MNFQYKLNELDHIIKFALEVERIPYRSLDVKLTKSNGILDRVDYRKSVRTNAVIPINYKIASLNFFN